MHYVVILRYSPSYNVTHYKIYHIVIIYIDNYAVYAIETYYIIEADEGN